MPRITLFVPRMTCRDCVRTVTSRLRDLSGVRTVQASALSAQLVVEGDVSEAAVRRALRDAGFPAAGPEPAEA
jgi:copper chaperone CopZ